MGLPSTSWSWPTVWELLSCPSMQQVIVATCVLLQPLALVPSGNLGVAYFKESLDLVCALICVSPLFLGWFWQSRLWEVPQFPKRSWLWNCGGPRRCALYSYVLVMSIDWDRMGGVGWLLTVAESRTRFWNVVLETLEKSVCGSLCLSYTMRARLKLPFRVIVTTWNRRMFSFSLGSEGRCFAVQVVLIPEEI